LIGFSFSGIAKAQTLTLDSCKNMALVNNHQVKEVNFELQQSEQVKKQVFTNFFPKVSATALAMRSSDYLIKGTTPQMNLPVYNGDLSTLASATQFTYVPSISLGLLDYMNMASVMAVQPVFAGGQIVLGNKMAKTATEIYAEKKAMTSTEVLVKTEELYWTLVSLKEKTKTLQSYHKLLDTLQRDVTSAVKAGLTQRSDLLKVQLKINEIEVNNLKLSNGINLSERALCQHIGIEFDSTLVLDSIVPEPEIPAKFFTDPKLAVSNRHEYKMLESNVKVEELQRKMSVGENLPQVAVGVTGFYADVMDQSMTNAMAFATVSIPISDWWGGSHKIKQNQIKVEIARNKLAETSELLTLQVVQANNELNEYYYQTQMDEKSLEQATENLRITTDNYKAGVVSMSDLLEAQSAWQEASDNLISARCDYQIKKARYLQTTGVY